MPIVVAVLSLSLVIEPDSGQALRYACDQLVSYCRESPRIEARVVEALPASDGSSASKGIVVLVGRSQAVRHAPDACRGIDWEGLGSEGFVLRIARAGERQTIVAAGNTEAGTRHALYALMCRLDVTKSPPILPADLNVIEKPSFNLRGMYAHQHWAYNHPYALRTWTVDEWKQYVDILALLRMNLFQIWSMAGILPVPLSPGDEAFLRRYPPVIEHARRNHGMEVWIGECANNVSEKQDLPPIEQRDYFEVETLKNPADPQQMADLKRARAEFYRICDQADGYWIIDSDPGGWKGSPASEFVDILMLNRRLIDAHTRLGTKAKLIYWMWLGWGISDRREVNWRDVAVDLARRNPEPWLMTVANGEQLKLADELKLADRVVYYPYGAVEPEPSLPFTTVVPKVVSDVLNVPERVGQIRGVMGNAQTPICQLPNIYYFTRAIWNMDLRSADREAAMRELARLIYPEQADLVAQCWRSLGSPEAPEADRLVRQLEKRIADNELGRPGPIGVKLFPDYAQVARDLAAQLRVHGVAMEVVRAAREKSIADDKVIEPLKRYCLLSLEWRRRTGFRNYGTNGYNFFPLREAVHTRWWRGDHLDKSVYAELESAMRVEYDAWEAELILYPLNH